MISRTTIAAFAACLIMTGLCGCSTNALTVDLLSGGETRVDRHPVEAGQLASVLAREAGNPEIRLGGLEVTYDRTAVTYPRLHKVLDGAWGAGVREVRLGSAAFRMTEAPETTSEPRAEFPSLTLRTPRDAEILEDAEDLSTTDVRLSCYSNTSVSLVEGAVAALQARHVRSINFLYREFDAVEIKVEFRRPGWRDYGCPHDLAHWCDSPRIVYVIDRSGFSPETWQLAKAYLVEKL